MYAHEKGKLRLEKRLSGLEVTEVPEECCC